MFQKFYLEICSDIDHAMVRLDELYEGNDFHNGDKMRINTRLTLEELQ